MSKALFTAALAATALFAALPAQARSLPCENYTRTVDRGGYLEIYEGTSCMRPDGSWMTVSEDRSYSNYRTAYYAPRPYYRPVRYVEPAYYPSTFLRINIGGGSHHRDRDRHDNRGHGRGHDRDDHRGRGHDRH